MAYTQKTDLQRLTFAMTHAVKAIDHNARNPEEALGSEAETLGLLNQLRLDTDSAIGLQAQHARSRGITWEAIGEALGMSRQAAHQRFSRG